MENILFILLIAGVALARWMIENATRKREERENAGTPPPPPPVPVHRAEPASRTAPAGRTPEEERVRKFLEALGVPTTNEPPPKAQPRPIREVVREKVERTVQQERRRVLNPVPPLTTTPPPLPPAPPLVPVPSPIEKSPWQELPDAFRERKPAPRSQRRPRKREAETSFPETTVASPSLLRARLGTPAALREAIVLREILGPPRGLQPAAERAV